MANPWTLVDVRSAYDAVAKAYSATLPDSSFEAPLDMAMIEEFSRQVGGTPERKVIDAGCGAGRMSAHLSAAGLDVLGADLSTGMVRTAHTLHPELAFDVGELAHLPAAPAAADGVLSWYSIIHSSRTALPAIAREFWRVLRPGGVALIAFQAGSGHRTSKRAYGHDVELRTELHAPDDVALHFAEQGFVLQAQLIRSARAMEKDPQAVLLLAKPPEWPPAQEAPVRR
ncbi:class I SAM-dependent methyltransferase [Arthrobacter sp. UYEF3]|uniref:class I SAM-dependent DNA methyltransferase n=1 Tax=Arthrobacter sp. UYEF3 TaxID=1756365 RepID=UPI00339A4DA4